MSLTYLQVYSSLQPQTRELLRRLGWLASAPLPRSLLTVGSDGTRDLDPGPSLALLKELEDCHMLQWHDDGATFSIPPALQSLPRSDLAPEESPPQSLVEALNWMRHATPASPDDPPHFALWSLLAPHLAAVTEYGANHRIAEPTGFLLNRLGLYEYAVAQYEPAERHFRKAISLQAESTETAPEKVASLYGNLAQLLMATNRLAEAEPLMRRALEIDEASYGKDHPNVARDLNNLALLLKDTNRLAEAEPLMRRAWEIDEASYGKDHPMVAIRLNNLVALLYATNRLAEAEPLMRRVVGIFEISWGKHHPKLATSLNNLAQLLHATKRFAEAEPLMRRALAINEAGLGTEHPSYALSLWSIAALLQATNRLAEAEPLMRRALDILTVSYGPEHPYSQGVQENLDALLAEMG